MTRTKSAPPPGKGFRDDADWNKAREASEKNGKLTTKVVGVYLNPTDFSKVK